MVPFIVYGLPRSRTNWLSWFLSYHGWRCYHDQGIHMRTLDDLRSACRMDYTGWADTGAALYWRVVQAYRPDAKVLVVRRPRDQVFDSLLRLEAAGAMTLDHARLRRLLAYEDHQLDLIEAQAGVLSVTFDDLAREETCAAVFEHCLPFPHDHAWWEQFAPMNLQCDMAAMTRYAAANRKQIDRFAVQMRAELRRLRYVGKITGRPLPVAGEPADDVRVYVGTVDEFLADGAWLVEEHVSEIGSPDGEVLDINYPLMRELEKAGLHVGMVARRGNAIVGYACFVISPSLNNGAVLQGHQSTSFVTKSARGVGPKLIKAGIDELKRHGVSEVFLRAGFRGSGTKYGALAKRLGGQDYGQIYMVRV